ncbi:metal-dependent hydrolase [Natrarchaeobius chitinivorans]|uniref:Metal-dependent hydrolase n=1 Tax=Natrarchaeobius chitinivorans TaxID=1679083 RepID=A0A3N6M4T6_NATCH|nr:metal-dependent hydrolase [Natrarchaeobius chitinivorans]RQG97037.1 metal-dependent hydrolase [Natrarchaeobius chitinivorans]
MWPWEHAIVGYLAYSLLCRGLYRRTPTGLEAFAVVFASVLPDLIDKPLAWEFGVFESGYALGHSIFFAVPLSIFVGVLASRVGRPGAGVAFGLGYLLHLPADVLDGYLRGGRVRTELMLWPVESVGHASEHTDFVGEFSRLFGGYQEALLAGELSMYMQVQLGLAVGVFVLWMLDGFPVFRECVDYARRALEAAFGRPPRPGPRGEKRE